MFPRGLLTLEHSREGAYKRGRLVREGGGGSFTKSNHKDIKDSSLVLLHHVLPKS